MGGVPNRTSYELHLAPEMSAWYSAVESADGQRTVGGRLTDAPRVDAGRLLDPMAMGARFPGDGLAPRTTVAASSCGLRGIAMAHTDTAHLSGSRTARQRVLPIPAINLLRKLLRTGIFRVEPKMPAQFFGKEVPKFGR